MYKFYIIFLSNSLPFKIINLVSLLSIYIYIYINSLLIDVRTN